MSEDKQFEWEEFAVKEPCFDHGQNNYKCSRFHTVSHVAHIESALRILKDGEIRPNLVYDKSRLKDKRISVSWVSPKDWSNLKGFRYGHIRFIFNWNSLITDKKFYKIEIADYKMPAPRILVTDRKHNGFDRYDHRSMEGPWFYDCDRGTHFFYESDCCVEFLIEDSISLDNCSKIDFVEHHPWWCSLHRNEPDRCQDKKHTTMKAASLFFSAAVCQSLDLSRFGFSLEIKGKRIPSVELHRAMSLIWMQLMSEKIQFQGKVRPQSVESKALARAILHAYSLQKSKEVYSLAAYFQSSEDLLMSCARLVCTHTGVEDPYMLIS